jgi:hypothetical protein
MSETIAEGVTRGIPAKSEEEIIRSATELPTTFIGRAVQPPTAIGYVSIERQHADKEALLNSHEWKSAGRIVKHLWIIFVLLPVLLGIGYALLQIK